MWNMENANSVEPQSVGDGIDENDQNLNYGPCRGIVLCLDNGVFVRRFRRSRSYSASSGGQLLEMTSMLPLGEDENPHFLAALLMPDIFIQVLSRPPDTDRYPHLSGQ